MQAKRGKRAVKRLLRSLIKRFGLPKRIVTDKLRSYGAARRKIASGLEHRSNKGLNKIGPRTAICRFENENGASKGFALRAVATVCGMSGN